MKKSIFINNESAGFGNNNPERVVESLRAAGFSVEICNLKKDNKFPAILQQPHDLVVVAGGDGTVKAVALEMPGKQIPLYIWPGGTSNNIATTFSISKDLSSFLQGGTKRLNAGSAKVDTHSFFFLESAGVGLLSSMFTVMKEKVKYNSNEEKINKSLQVLVEMLNRKEEYELKLELDGERHDGSYLMVEVMNTRFTGPRLFMAPEAEPGDDLLDVVLIGKEERNELESYLQDRLRGKQRPLQATVHKCRKVKMTGKDLDFHVDDDVHRFSDEVHISLEVHQEGVQLQVD